MVKCGFKYGCDFILYKENDPQKFKDKKHEHGEYLVLVHQENSCEDLSLKIASFVRLASIVHKKAIFTYVSDNKVNFIEISFQ